MLLYRMLYTWNQYSKCHIISPIDRMHRSRNRRRKWEWNLSANNLLKQYLLSISVTSCFMGRRILVSMWEMLPLENIIMVLSNLKLTNQKLSLPSGHYELLKLLNWPADKGTTIIAEVIDVIYQQKIRLLPHKGDEKNYFWSLEGFFRSTSLLQQPG